MSELRGFGAVLQQLEDGQFIVDAGDALADLNAKLGKDALALLLEHEFPGGAEGIPCCSECGMGPPFMKDGERCQGHTPDCKVGAVCDAARRLG